MNGDRAHFPTRGRACVGRSQSMLNLTPPRSPPSVGLPSGSSPRDRDPIGGACRSGGHGIRTRSEGQLWSLGQSVIAKDRRGPRNRRLPWWEWGVTGDAVDRCPHRGRAGRGRGRGVDRQRALPLSGDTLSAGDADRRRLATGPRQQGPERQRRNGNRVTGILCTSRLVTRTRPGASQPIHSTKQSLNHVRAREKGSG
jgi:hypothetical protein